MRSNYYAPNNARKPAMNISPHHLSFVMGVWEGGRGSFTNTPHNAAAEYERCAIAVDKVVTRPP
jgi:hypothetical protein